MEINNDYLSAFYKRVEEIPAEKYPPIEINVGEDISLNRDVLRLRLNNIDEIKDYELTNLIKLCIDRICEDILNADAFYIEKIQNRKFLDSFVKVISCIPIDDNKRLCCNKLAYDYLTLADKGDEYIKRKLLDLSRIVNKRIIDRLASLSLDPETSCNLALARYASMNEEVNVKRLNFVICNKDSDIMTEQMIIYIYETLFKRITPLFEGSMFEWYSNSDADELGESFMTIYSAISLAVLTILSNMPSIDIRKVLVGYSAKWQFNGRPPVRFSMRALSGDFARINTVVESLEREGIFLP